MMVVVDMIVWGGLVVQSSTDDLLKSLKFETLEQERNHMLFEIRTSFIFFYMRDCCNVTALLM